MRFPPGKWKNTIYRYNDYRNSIAVSQKKCKNLPVSEAENLCFSLRLSAANHLPSFVNFPFSKDPMSVLPLYLQKSGYSADALAMFGNKDRFLFYSLAPSVQNPRCDLSYESLFARYKKRRGCAFFIYKNI